MKNKKDFKKLLADAQLPVKTVPICLRGDLVADFEETERALQEAHKQRGDSLAGGSELGELAEKLEALQVEMREHFYTFRIQALPKREFRALVAKHGPRRVVGEDGEEKIHEDDKYIGVNTASFFEALMRACLVDPVLGDDDWTALDSKLTDSQWDSLSTAAWSVNRSDVDVPFSRAASLINRRTASE